MRTAQELVELIPGMTIESATAICTAQRKAHAPTATRFWELICAATTEFAGIWDAWEERRGKVMVEVYDEYRLLFEDTVKRAGLTSTSGRAYNDERLHSPMRLYYINVPMEHETGENKDETSNP